MRLKTYLHCLCVLLTCGMAPAWGAMLVTVEDFEKVASPPSVWVVNIPNENASVQLSSDQPHDGKLCLKLHYHFVGAGHFQYLGIMNKVRIQAPVHQLRFWLKGDNLQCAYGVQLTDAGGETHQYSKNTGQGGIVDFTGWKEVVIDLDSPHETWGGDKNGKIDYPITAVTFTIIAAASILQEGLALPLGKVRRFVKQLLDAMPTRAVHFDFRSEEHTSELQS